MNQIKKLGLAGIVAGACLFGNIHAQTNNMSKELLNKYQLPKESYNSGREMAKSKDNKPVEFGINETQTMYLIIPCEETFSEFNNKEYRGVIFIESKQKDQKEEPRKTYRAVPVDYNASKKGFVIAAPEDPIKDSISLYNQNFLNKPPKARWLQDSKFLDENALHRVIGGNKFRFIKSTFPVYENPDSKKPLETLPRMFFIQEENPEVRIIDEEISHINAHLYIPVRIKDTIIK